MSEYKTIRKTGAIPGMPSEHFLRIRQKQGKLPGFYTGNRFLVDVDALADMLRAESLAAVRQEAERAEVM